MTQKIMTTAAKSNSFTFREETPDGTAWIHVIEAAPGQVDKVIFQIGKAGTALNSYCYALAALVTLHLQNDGSVTDIIDELMEISSMNAGRLRKSPDEPVNRSGPEALAKALMSYLQSLPTNVLENQGERRIARFKSAIL